MLRIPSRIKDLCLIIFLLFISYLVFHRIHTSTTTSVVLLSHNPATFTITSTARPSATTLCHILFSIAASSDSFSKRKHYINLWYNPNSTRAYIFLDRPTPNPFPSDATLPPILISGDTSKFPYTFPGGYRSAVRIARIVKEAVDLDETGVHWFVFGDDDTVFFTENLVRTLSKYDHDQWYYVGTNSECYEQNSFNSFDMAFGGGGFAISHSLARVLARVLDSCLMRYPHLYGSDARVFSCLAELGVGLTHEFGFHQVDFWGDLFGMLSSHPLAPLVSLHHFDRADPIFPNMTRIQALEHLFKAANADPARILQQTVCYDSSNSLTVSVSWGYAVQIYEGYHLLPDLLPLQKTFRPWKIGRNKFSRKYMFNTRDYPEDPCKRPVVFFWDSVGSDHKVWTDYIRYNVVANCSRKEAIQKLERIKVFSDELDMDSGEVRAPRRQCCDIFASVNKTMTVRVRDCGVDELISPHVENQS
ncbi:unnamed protein product [Ilex paraguariensis]|uniref:Uncharacterized protein n=1 Tax=Ilex paraguariensis TaxID=185542 RepID=A0ABC8RD71_9AQUA